MSGKEIKDYILNRDDIYYNIIVIDDKKINGSLMILKMKLIMNLQN